MNEKDKNIKWKTMYLPYSDRAGGVNKVVRFDWEDEADMDLWKKVGTLTSAEMRELLGIENPEDMERVYNDFVAERPDLYGAPIIRPTL